LLLIRGGVVCGKWLPLRSTCVAPPHPLPHKGPSILWRPGRVDAPDNATCPPDGNLPDASKDAGHVREVFGRMNFTDQEAVALIGGCPACVRVFWGDM
jgi:hypothetical protein